ncbi:hypothetical protein CC77DRAFT_1018180 [Alternaria alternata]|uniref:Uncharacterized protein n=1 Tax=Alternaria alternata TaxID=5599 RepID=A0A177DV28_ALTAL|nr:hypothetical protein CC77DRAFT_1018180 [Alternaria alternata]OAG23348.1 hypothetical protein CC77DRAFT_1018180 [Alternaria alternata]
MIAKECSAQTHETWHPALIRIPGKQGPTSTCAIIIFPLWAFILKSMLCGHLVR